MAGAPEAFVRLRGKIPSTPTCSFSEFEIVFTRPDGLKLWGFGLGGYYNQPNTTYVKYWAPR